MMIPMTPMVKKLLIINLVVWVVFQLILEKFSSIPFTSFFALVPEKLLIEFHLWQVGSYMFLHSTQPTHIFFNMIMLWFIGSELEQRWGKKFFLLYYLVCGIGAALLYSFSMLIYSLITGHSAGMFTPVIGASGAIFGLMLAHGIIFSERIVYFFMMFPMKNKYVVMILGAFQLFSMLSSGGEDGGVAYLAHLGGLVSGFVFLRTWAFWQRRKADRNNPKKKSGSHLRLIVDNEKDPSDKNGPRYWN